MANQQKNPKSNSQYWASFDQAELLGTLNDKIDDYKNYLLKSGKLSLWRALWTQYYKNERKIGLSVGGDRGQYKLICVNHFYSIINALISIVNQQRPAPEAFAINDDAKSMGQQQLAVGILDYYNKQYGLENTFRDATQIGLIFGEAFVSEQWDAALGKPVEADESGTSLVKEGDIVVSIYNPMDVVRDYTRTDNNNDWYILRRYVNKWDLISKRPDLKDKISGLSIPSDLQRFRFGHLIDVGGANDDLVPEYTFVHKKTAALPTGRITVFVEDAVVLDAELPYDDIPLKRLSPDNVISNNFGTSIAPKLYELQTTYDKLCSTVVTNQATFGVQSVQIPLGMAVKVEELVDGLNAIRANGDIKPLQLTATPAEIFNFIEKLEMAMEKISGINATLRGNPPPNLESGTALAFVQAQALVVNSSLQQSYVKLVEDCYTSIINILKTYANTKRMITIAGKSKKMYQKFFTKDDISNISRVQVNIGSPLMKSLAGRVQVADNLLNKDMIKIKEEYISLIETGQSDSLVESEMSQLMLVRQENEDLSNGVEVPVTAFDNHPLHMLEHATVFSSPEARRDPKILTVAMAHMQEHMKVWKDWSQTDPQMLAALKIQPLMVTPAMPDEGNTTGNPGSPLPSGLPATVEPAAPNAPNLPPGTPDVTMEASQQINPQI